VEPCEPVVPDDTGPGSNPDVSISYVGEWK
jgi:hypothetical protein